MPEYIEREAAIEEAIDAVDEWSGGYNPHRAAMIRDGINTIPAADVALVRHGHKITHNRPIAGYWASGLLDGGINGMEGRVWVMPIMDNPVDYCSECGKRLDDTFQNYCPNCGAKLDGE